MQGLGRSPQSREGSKTCGDQGYHELTHAYPGVQWGVMSSLRFHGPLHKLIAVGEGERVEGNLKSILLVGVTCPSGEVGSWDVLSRGQQ